MDAALERDWKDNYPDRRARMIDTYGVSIIVSETTRDLVPEYAYRELDRVRVKGKAKPVAIFAVLVTLLAVSPFTPGSVSMISTVMCGGRSMETGLPL